MKKAIALFAACVLLAACGASTEQTPAEQTEDTEQTTTSVTTENIDEPKEPAVNENPDFRNVSWGMSFDDVKKYEDATLIREDNSENATSLIYGDVSVMNHPARILYIFSNGKLSSADYILDVTEEQDYQINNEFFDIADGITAKYGDPEKESLIIYCNDKMYYERQIFWESSGFSFDTSNYDDGSDLRAKPMYQIRWGKGNTEIVLMLFISQNDDGIYVAPDTYNISYSAIDVDNAL